MTTDETILACLGCGCELPTEQDVHQISGHGPFCASCAQSAEGVPYDQWLDERWRREHPN